MPVYHHREKLLNTLVYFARNTKFCGKTKLYKLLFYLDFTHFKQTGQSVTGLDYYAWKFGPAPRELHEEFEALPPDIDQHITLLGSPDTFTGVKAKKQFSDKYFTKREIRILKELSEMFRDARAEDMVEASHMIDQPWDITRKTKGMYTAIDYFLVLDDSPESIYIEEAKERLLDQEQIESAFK